MNPEDQQPESLSGDVQPGAYLSEEAQLKKESSKDELQRELDRLEKTSDGENPTPLADPTSEEAS